RAPAARRGRAPRSRRGPARARAPRASRRRRSRAPHAAGTPSRRSSAPCSAVALVLPRGRSPSRSSEKASRAPTRASAEVGAVDADEAPHLPRVPAQVVAEREPLLGGDLALPPGLAAHLEPALEDHAEPARADRMPEGLEPAIGIDG